MKMLHWQILQDLQGRLGRWKSHWYPQQKGVNSFILLTEYPHYVNPTLSLLQLDMKNTRVLKVKEEKFW